MAGSGMYWTLGLSVSGALASMRAFMGGISGISGSMSRLGSGGAAAIGKVTGALSGLGNVLFKLPSQVQSITAGLQGLSLPSRLAGSAETTSVAFRVLIGDAEKADRILGEIRDLANSTPFEFPELAGAARMLAAFGEDADSIPAILRRIGDVAAGTGTNVKELAELYGKARVQGTLFAEDINQLTGRGIPIIQEFAKQLGVPESEIKKMAADGKITFPMLAAAFKDLTGEGGKFAGMMESISQTFEGKLSTLSDSFNGLLTKLGAGINEGLKPVMDELTAQLDAQGGMAKSIGENIGHGIEVGLELFKSGQLGELIGAQLKVAGMGLVEVIVRGFQYAGELLKIAALEAAAAVTPGQGGKDLASMAKMRGAKLSKEGFWGNQDDEPGSARIGPKTAPMVPGMGPGWAKDVQAARDAIFNRASRKVDENRAGRAAAAEEKNAEAVEKAKKDQADSVESYGLGGGSPGEVAERFAAKEAADAKAKAAAEKEAAETDKWYEETYGTPAQKTGPKAAPRPAFAAMVDAGMTAATGSTAAGSVSGGRGRIKGAIMPDSYQWKDGRKVMAHESEQRGKSDRMKAAAGRPADQRAQAAEKALGLLEKHLPEIARTLKQAVED